MRILITIFCVLSLAVSGADLQRGVTFVDGQRVTAANLHSLVDSGTILAGFYTGKTAQTNFAATDLILAYSPSLGGYRKITAANGITSNPNLITGQLEVTNWSGGDTLLMFDESAGQLVKIATSNFVYQTGFGLTNDGTTLSLLSFTNTAIAIPTTNVYLTNIHGFTNKPSFMAGVIICTNADLGFSVGEEVALTSLNWTNTADTYIPVNGFTSCDTTNVYNQIVGNASWFLFTKTNPNVRIPITKTSWNLKFYAKP